MVDKFLYNDFISDFIIESSLPLEELGKGCQKKYFAVSLS